MKRDFYQDVYTISIRSDLDHMRISGTEPSSVILGLTKYFEKLKTDITKVLKQTEAKRGGVINPQNYNFNKFQHRKFIALKTLQIN